MTSIEFKRGQGGIPKTLKGEDHYSGFCMFMPEADIPVGFPPTSRIQGISTLEMAEALGVDASATSWYSKALHYHVSEILRINPGIVLYVGLFPEKESGYTFSEIKEMQNFASGRLRQVAVYAPALELSGIEITALQGVASLLELQDQPLSILYAANVANITSLVNLSGLGKKNVSVVISQAGEGIGAELFFAPENTPKKSVTTLGNALGMLSLAKVNESIAWVEKFPAGVDIPAFADGTLYKSLDFSVIDTLDTNRYLFLKTLSGLSGSFYNDSHTLDLPTSDYNAIELVRTMDKAVRGIRTYLQPRLGSPLSVDPTTGKLDPSTVAHLELTAGKALEQMECAAELSGYKVEIDPDQNVLASSCVEFVIKQVPIGVMRKVIVKIGFTTQI